MFDITASLNAVESMVKRSGYFSGQDVLIGEPKSQPGGSRLTAAIWMRSVGVQAVALNGFVIERHSFTIRVYRREDESPAELQELELADAVAALEKALMADFPLQQTVRNVDPGGMTGERLSTDFGYVELGGTHYRVADISVPLVVDDPMTFAAVRAE
jgi:hypothetical protein